MIEPAVITAIISGLCVAIPSIITTVITQNAHEAIQTERMNNMTVKIDTLAVKVDQLADFDKRISLLEHDIKELSEKIEKGGIQ